MERLLQLQLQIQLQRGPTINNNPNLFVNPWKQQQQQGNVEESYGSFLLNPTKEEAAEEEQLRLPEQEEEWQQQSVVQFPLPSLEDRMPFLQMLQSVETPTPFSSFTQPPHLQQLLSSTLQQPQKHWEERSYYNFTKEMELESCITHDICETKEEEEEDRDPHPTMEVVNSSACNYNGESSNAVQADKEEEAAAEKSKKRKSSTTARGAKAKGRGSKKKKEEIENQRMTHIAVERNRRKQMNDHLHALRSLMPSCFVQRGDQASIIGGAIDFVKELEQHLQSLEAQKRMKMRSSSSSSCKSESELEEDDDDESSYNSRRDRKKGRAAFISNGFVTSSPSTTSSSMGMGQGIEIEVRVIESHVNLKIVSPRRGGGQLVRAIAALEDLRLAVLHLNVTSFDHSSVLFSFSLKMEEGCELGSGDEIAAAVCQIFSIINTTPPPTSNSNL